jgi:hypothetical protein
MKAVLCLLLWDKLYVVPHLRDGSLISGYTFIVAVKTAFNDTESVSQRKC